MGALLGGLGGLVSKAIPWLGKNVLPAVLGGLGGGGQAGGGTIGGQQQQQPQQNMFMPAQVNPSRTIPNYGQMIQAMLSQQRGGM